jgi:cytochrome c oxidase assembly factor CtaG
MSERRIYFFLLSFYFFFLHIIGALSSRRTVKQGRRYASVVRSRVFLVLFSFLCNILGEILTMAQPS